MKEKRNVQFVHMQMLLFPFQSSCRKRHVHRQDQAVYQRRTRNVASPTAPPPPSQRSKPEKAHADSTVPIPAYHSNCLDFVLPSPCSPVETCSLSRDEKKEWSKRSHANVVIPMSIIYHTQSTFQCAYADDAVPI